MSFIAGPYTVTIASALIALAGGRLTNTVAVPGARPGMNVKVTAQTDMGASVLCDGFVSSNDVVTVWMMGIISLTPPTTVFNVMVWS